MSQFCQFCDKEMMFEQAVVHVKGYITCGHKKCKKQAEKNSAYHAEHSMEDSGPKEVEIVVLESKTPLVPDSWTLVQPEDFPEFMADPETVGMMLQGNIANVDAPNKKDTVFYRAVKLEDLKEQLGVEDDA